MSNGVLDYCTTIFMTDHPNVVIDLKDDVVYMQRLGGGRMVTMTITDVKKDVINDILEKMYKELR